VLAPHADDEVFGAGATLALAGERGVEVRLVIVTNGAEQGEAVVREAEAREASKALGLAPPEFWRLPDRGLDPGDAQLTGTILDTCTRADAETLFVTSPVELHPDHRALALATQRALRRRWLSRRWRARLRWVVTYEVATPHRADVLVAADAGWERKRRAAACYSSQLAVRSYERAMEGLGDLRALTLEGVGKAEAFGVFNVRWLAWHAARAWEVRCSPTLTTRSRPH
jgi:N-acetylglucosamine malate deacetylase 1